MEKTNLEHLSDVELRSLLWRYSWYVAAKVEACRRGLISVSSIAPFVLNGAVILKKNAVQSVNEAFCRAAGALEQEALEDISIESVQEDKELISETLAEIYLQQGLKDKALETYWQLNLKYPEKSVYFADRIRQIEAM